MRNRSELGCKCFFLGLVQSGHLQVSLWALVPELLARGQRLHVEGVVGVLGGHAEPLVKAVLPLASPALVLTLHRDLAVGLCHLLSLQRIVQAFLLVLPSLFSSHLRVTPTPLIQKVIFLPPSEVELVVDLAGALRVLRGLRAPAELGSQEQGSDNDAIDEEDPIQQVAESGIQQAEALGLCSWELGLQDGGDDKHLPLHAVLSLGWCWDAGAVAAVVGQRRQRECVLAALGAASSGSGGLGL